MIQARLRAHPRQLLLLTRAQLGPSRLEHGGAIGQGERKLARPFSGKRPMHLVLGSSRARGPWHLRRPQHAAKIHAAMRAAGRRHGVRVYEFANAGNHLHLLVRARSRAEFQSFLRGLAGIVARIVTGATKGRPIGKFWDSLAYSRVLQWGQELCGIRDYVLRNELEALRLIPYQERPSRRSPRAGPARR